MKNFRHDIAYVAEVLENAYYYNHEKLLIKFLYFISFVNILDESSPKTELGADLKKTKPRRPLSAPPLRVAGQTSSPTRRSPAPSGRPNFVAHSVLPPPRAGDLTSSPIRCCPRPEWQTEPRRPLGVTPAPSVWPNLVAHSVLRPPRVANLTSSPTRWCPRPACRTGAITSVLCHDRRCRD